MRLNTVVVSLTVGVGIIVFAGAVEKDITTLVCVDNPLRALVLTSLEDVMEMWYGCVHQIYKTIK